MAESFARELRVAELAVQKAALVTERVRKDIANGTFSKSDDDKTPVTIADFAAQAILVSSIKHNFPQDLILAEEESTMLRENSELCSTVWQLVSSARLEDAESEALVPSPSSPEKMMEFIDFAGLSNGSPTGRVWIFDPIDGTRCFVGGGLHVIVCCMIQDGEEKVTALGCPVLDTTLERISDFHFNADGPGYLVSAVKGHGAQIRSLSNGSLLEARKLVEIKQPTDTSSLEFLEPDPPRRFRDAYKIAEKLGSPFEPGELFSAQAKYIAMALGSGNIVLRIKVPEKAKKTYVYDHAGGMMLYEEVGGKVTDMNGKALDFSYGRQFEGNYCIVAAPKSVHPQVLEAARAILRLYPEYAKGLKQ